MAEALREPAAVARAGDGRPVVWIGERLARAAYARLIAEHGGPAAAVEPLRLAAVLAWPRTVAAFGDSPPRLSTLAAAYASAVVRMRPYREGNEAMACLLSMLFLRINGVELPAPPIEKYAMYAGLADDRIDSQALSQWMRMRHIANQRSVHTVVTIRVVDGKVRGVATMQGRAPRPPALSARKHTTRTPRHPSS